METSDARLDIADSTAIQALHQVLQQHNYTPDGLFEALGQDHGITLKRSELPIYLHRLQDIPLHNLMRLFLLDAPVERDALAETLSPLAPEALVALGLAHATDGKFASPFRLMTFEDLYLICDRHFHGDTLQPDYVTGVNNTSINLAALTIRRPGRGLDLGTGCGVQALLASRHCEQVIATDLNPRALEIARFNAALNGVTNIEWRLGSLYDPIAGETFDLIICNPPYVISPQTDYIFRNAGLSGDAASRLIVTESPRHLNDGGFATILCDWIHTLQEDWWKPLESWVANTGCDALLLCHRTTDPLNYAAGWAQQPVPIDASALERQLCEWMAYYAELGIQSISGGAVVLRKSADAHWIHSEMLPGSPIGASGTHIARMFAAQDYLKNLFQEPLLNTVIAPLDGRIDQTLKHAEGELKVEAMQWRIPFALGFSGPLDALTVHLLASFDGSQSLRALTEQAAQNAGVDLDAILGSTVQQVRRWIEVGLVVPVR